jgi:membrane protease YdiL (CAAX protease family)
MQSKRRSVSAPATASTSAPATAREPAATTSPGAISSDPRTVPLPPVSRRAATRLVPGSLPPAAEGEALLPRVYLAAIAFAEMATRMSNPGLGAMLFAVALIAGLNQAAATIGPERALLVTLSVVALERLLSVAMPLVPVGEVDRFVLVAMPTLAGIALAARLARYSRHDLGLVIDAQIVRASLFAIPPGLAVGFVYYWMVRPLPLITELTMSDFLAPVVVLALTTGLVEEMLFRGLLLRAASCRLGPLPGTMYAGGLYAILSTTPLSGIGIATVFVTALCLSGLTIKTGSIVPAAVAHASLNVGLLLLAPFLLSGPS